jgi:leucyl aminopeptidase
MWPLPIDDYRELIKSGIADIQNVGIGKGGGATVAAMFLKELPATRRGFTSTSPEPPGRTT